ncbi:hypothetical protein EBB59_03450 [Lysobacter pythonis]|uniref:Lipoprotein n=1 Tax=Solilutibacter pythonis TaxID=2483112 RepID=A0A3M2I179_9GAMM|nr:hypothetical protein [Lysobacter pythonis]RMH93720.1 hypothetical protein EBB59_03450 [Lysobacter pythonis]
MKILAPPMLCLALAACAAQPPPPPERHDELRKAIEAPLGEAKQAEAIQRQAEAERRRQLEAATQ